MDATLKENDIIELHTSMRFRKPSELLRQETSNELFKLVED